MERGMTKDYLVEIKVKNNLLYKKIRDSGYASMVDFAKKNGIGYQTLINYLNLSRAPIDSRTGNWTKAFTLISDALRCMPGDICPPQHLNNVLKRNKAKLEAGAEEIAGYITGNADTANLALNHIIQRENDDLIQEAIAKLTDREQDVIRRRYGFDGDLQTYDEIGKSYGVTKERIRQIEAKALRRMRGLSITKEIGKIADEMGLRHGYIPPRHYVPEWKVKEAVKKPVREEQKPKTPDRKSNFVLLDEDNPFLNH